MKRLAAAAICALLCISLCACASLIPSEYSHIAPHTESQPAPAELSPNVRLAANMNELKQAVRSFVDDRVEHGVIRVYSYPGNVEEDVSSAVYQVAREDPYGAYVVDYITHSCSLIVSYYEIEIDITFRADTPARSELEYATSTTGAKQLIEQAVDRYAARVVIYLTYYTAFDAEKAVQDYCARYPERLMAVPSVQMAMYPESGQSRILEIRLSYPYEPAMLREMAGAVGESLDAASVYVRYRQSEREKTELLFTYLMERFAYQEGQSRTPVYSFLCEGIASAKSAAVSWQLLCDKAGIACQTVSGMRAGSEYWWNIVQLDGTYYHVDIYQDLLAGDTLHRYYDTDMTDYYWDMSQVPACPAPETEQSEQPAQSDETEAPQPDSEQTPPDDGDETQPDPETPEPDTSAAVLSAPRQ